jgi:hypothetical protein
MTAGFSEAELLRIEPYLYIPRSTALGEMWTEASAEAADTAFFSIIAQIQI